ncbi:MAG TPA: peptidylprolyl isomerase [Polyangium sp.]|nr:peptidylprolyl isomerase [Polyangium sp.]
MSKESDKNRKDEEDPELDDEQEEEEEDEEDEEEEGEDEDEEEDEEEEASNAPSKAASAATNADEEDDEEDEEDDEEDEEDDEEDEDDHHGGTEGHHAHGDEEDPYWWTPHVVLGVLVLVGILGFFGMFNKPLAFLAAKPVAPQGDTHEAAAPAPAPQPTQARPMPQPNQPQQQQPAREMFGAKHFLVMYKGSTRAPATITRTKEEAKARAEEGLKKIKDGKKFEEVVAEYSDEPGAGQRGGDLGTFPKGAMVAEFQAGLEKIKVGEVSGLVETSFGYHVILRTK